MTESWSGGGGGGGGGGVSRKKLRTGGALAVEGGGGGVFRGSWSLLVSHDRPVSPSLHLFSPGFYWSFWYLMVSTGIYWSLQVSTGLSYPLLVSAGLYWSLLVSMCIPVHLWSVRPGFTPLCWLTQQLLLTPG